MVAGQRINRRRPCVGISLELVPHVRHVPVQIRRYNAARSRPEDTMAPSRTSAQIHELLARVMADTAREIAGGQGAHRVGPFLATIHPTSDMIWLNYAIPVGDDLDPARIPAQMGELRRIFRAHQRILRIECFRSLTPDLAPSLESAGLVLQSEMPLMFCDAGTLRPVRAEGVEVQPLTADDGGATLRRFLRTARQAFDQPEEIRDVDVVEQRENLRQGRFRAVYARIDDAWAGVGSMTARTGELVGIGTLPEHRRRGVAATISSVLTDDHFARGEPLVWLSAGDQTAVNVYTKIGFYRVGGQLNYIDRT
jgi:GNAT superfamily N-acetyltransferase